ncbi:MAG: MBL fold metallo-hydrolase, partial [Gemmatimonadetes bacterium]|nr:MBL fold metallo-hydrolase [Gemmatimonadota bacterium]
MLIKRLYDEPLAQAAWLVGCQATGTACVIDPNRDVAGIIAAAAAEGLRITHVTETHIHADFVSGARDLAHATGALLLLSDEGGDGWRYAFRDEAGVRLIHDGDTFMVGNLKFEVMHTPGHTPEHVVFILTDTPASDRPVGVFTGDFVFVGDVGRPDLLERAAHIAGTMEKGARQLYASLQRFKQLPDYLQLWPGHGAGSARGKALGAVPSSTLGYERMVNWGLRAATEEAFVTEVLAGQPEPPAYFAEMKRLNRDGAPALAAMPVPAALPPFALAEALDAGATVIDLRPGAEFLAHHAPGSLGIPFSKSFSTYAGSVVPFGARIFLLASAANARVVAQAARDLALIGYDNVVGAFGVEALDALAKAGRPIARMADVSATEAAQEAAAGVATLLDVRKSSEYAAGHVAGAQLVPLQQLAARLAEVPRDRPLIVHCQGGTRSIVAASLLES